MCIICSSPASSIDDLQKATAKHKKDRLIARAVEIKEMVGDCKNILRIHREAGSQDEENERVLRKLLDEQYALSREM